MTTARCTACGHEFSIDLDQYRVPGEETAKFADGAGEKTWWVWLVCPKCEHRKFIEIGEGP